MSDIPVRHMDDPSATAPSTLAALPAVRGPATLPVEPQDQGQCQRQAGRCMADLPMHVLRRHVEPAGPGATGLYRWIDPLLLASLRANDPLLADRPGLSMPRASDVGLPAWRKPPMPWWRGRCFPGSTARPPDLRVLSSCLYSLAAPPGSASCRRATAVAKPQPGARDCPGRRGKFPAKIARHLPLERYATGMRLRIELSYLDARWLVECVRSAAGPGGPGGVSLASSIGSRDPRRRAGRRYTPGPRAVRVGPAARRAVVAARGARPHPLPALPRGPTAGPRAGRDAPVGPAIASRDAGKGGGDRSSGEATSLPSSVGPRPDPGPTCRRTPAWGPLSAAG